MKCYDVQIFCDDLLFGFARHSPHCMTYVHRFGTALFTIVLGRASISKNHSLKRLLFSVTSVELLVRINSANNHQNNKI